MFMAALIIDLKDSDTRTPEQVVRVFCTLYAPQAVEAALWDIFKVCAGAAGEKGEADPGLAATAVLFDHLIALAKAVHVLQDGGG